MAVDEKTKEIRKKPCYSAISSTMNLTWSRLASKPHEKITLLFFLNDFVPQTQTASLTGQYDPEFIHLYGVLSLNVGAL